MGNQSVKCDVTKWMEETEQLSSFWNLSMVLTLFKVFFLHIKIYGCHEPLGSYPFVIYDADICCINNNEHSCKYETPVSHNQKEAQAIKSVVIVFL